MNGKTMVKVHEETDECDGLTSLAGWWCDECEKPMCACGMAYGHDCEDS